MNVVGAEIRPDSPCPKQQSANRPYVMSYIRSISLFFWGCIVCAGAGPG